MKKVEFPVTVKRGSVAVKIYHTPSHGCDSFTLSYYQDGGRKRPTFPTFQQAKDEADAVVNRLGSADADVLILTSADRAAYMRLRQILDPLGIPIEAAAVLAAETKKRLGDVPWSYVMDDYLKRNPTKIEPKAVSVVVEELLKAKTADKLSDRYIQSLKWALGKLTKRFHCNIGALCGADIDSWLRDSGLSPRTRNNLRTAVQTLFSFAKSRQYVPKGHDELDAVPVMKDRGGAIEVFTTAELVEVLNHSGEGLIPFITLGAFAGIRHAEIQRLDWKDVRFDDNIVEIHAAKAKTASRRTIPLLDNLRQWLLPHREKSGPVCAYQNVAFEMHMIAKRANEARRAAWAKSKGVTDEQLKENEKRAKAAAKEKTNGRQKGEVPPGAETAAIEGWTPFAWKHNALRHSFISYRVAETQNVAQVALEAGNSPQMIFSNYRELVRPVDAKAWFALAPGKEGKVIQMPMSKAA